MYVSDTSRPTVIPLKELVVSLPSLVLTFLTPVILSCAYGAAFGTLYVSPSDGRLLIPSHVVTSIDSLTRARP